VCMCMYIPTLSQHLRPQHMHIPQPKQQQEKGFPPFPHCVGESVGDAKHTDQC
jgi:hypothetical protein